LVEDREKILDDLLIKEYLTKGLKSKAIEDKTQLENKLISPKSSVSQRYLYYDTVDEETGKKVRQVVPFHTLFKEQLTEDITTSNLSEEQVYLIGEQYYLSQIIQKICLMSGFPFKDDSLNLVEAADYFTDLSNLDVSLRKSKEGFGARLIKSDYAISSSKQEVLQQELQPQKKSWWKLGR